MLLLYGKIVPDEQKLYKKFRNIKYDDPRPYIKLGIICDSFKDSSSHSYNEVVRESNKCDEYIRLGEVFNGKTERKFMISSNEEFNYKHVSSLKRLDDVLILNAENLENKMRLECSYNYGWQGNEACETENFLYANLIMVWRFDGSPYY